MADKKYGYKTVNVKPQTFTEMHILAELMLDRGEHGLTVDKVLAHAIDVTKSTEIKQINVV